MVANVPNQPVVRRIENIMQGNRKLDHAKARAEMLINDAREAIQNEAPLDRVRSLTAELQQLYHGFAAAQPGGGGANREDDAMRAAKTLQGLP